VRVADVRHLRNWLSLASLIVVTLLIGGCAAEAQQTTQKPNIIFILTDDQDARSLKRMPIVQREIIEKGTTFKNGILTTPVCCPSRATMLRGQYTHNHGIISAGKAAQLFLDGGLERNTVATWLDQAGYRTALVGKYINGYAESLNDSTDYRHVPPGWDRWYANASRDIWAKCLNENGRKRCYGGHPDAVLAEKAEGFVRANRGSAAPLFLWLAFSAPHDPAPYMDQDRNRFDDTPLPKSPSFNEKDVSDKPSWVRSKPRLTREEIRNHTRFYRDRLRSLQTVDRAVGRLIDALADTGRLNNTYIVFWTDNGYHMGEHRLSALGGSTGKGTPYVEDIRVPLIVRGPSVARGEGQELVLNTDIAPTFAELAGAQPADFVDGRSFVPLLRGETSLWRTAGLIELRGSQKLNLPAYTGMFMQNRTYVEYANGAKELYDLQADPYQLRNTYKDVKDTNPTLIADLETRLEALRSCKREGCRTAENGSNP
jgi:N-acetylglucosamine-6-sulfatase